MGTAFFIFLHIQLLHRDNDAENDSVSFNMSSSSLDMIINLLAKLNLMQLLFYGYEDDFFT